MQGLLRRFAPRNIKVLQTGERLSFHALLLAYLSIKSGLGRTFLIASEAWKSIFYNTGKQRLTPYYNY